MEDKEIKDIIEWIKNYVESAHAKGVVIGMSGGKDSLIVAKLCTLAIGEKNVFGVIMPNGEMQDYSDAVETCKLLNIPYTTINIENTYSSIIENVKSPLNSKNVTLNSVTTINVTPRVRMTTLYALAGSLNYLVANTSNLSETCVGYSTKWGDNVGDFSPVLNFTKNEVCEIGLKLGLPEKLVNKTPSDGLTGKSDEDNLGISYKNLDEFIRNGTKTSDYEKIILLYKKSSHKRNPMASFKTNKPNHLEKESK